MSDKVSIVMPLYNSENTIAKTIESVLAQTYSNWEINIVDDCSTDKSADIVKAYAKKDKRIKYYRLSENSGAAIARNTSINFADGKYLAFLDSDDLWFKDKLKMQVDFMQYENVGFSFTEYSMVNEHGELIKERVKSPAKISFKGLLSGSPIMCSSVMLDIEKFSQIVMPDIKSGQDYATWALLLKETDYAHNVGKVLAVYLKQKSSLSSKKVNALKRTWRINRKLLHVGFFSCLMYIFVYSLKWIFKHYF